ncbi:MAG: hypothetical protein EDM74_01990 [Armatimonadetes bacterium]|nr:MAG: hypothetical protein EDM74_01990 [Armatimonadota bacterium]
MGRLPATTYVSRQARRGKRSGSILIDAIVGVFVLALAASAFFSMMPVIDRAQRIAHEQSTASNMAARMVEHLQLLNAKDLNVEALTSLELIDAGQDGLPYRFDNVPLDDSTGFSPAQAFRNGTGSLDIVELSAGARKAVVTIGWVSDSGKSKSFVTATVLGGYK